MKLTIIELQQFSAQERSDLQKIWPLADITALQQQLDEQHRLYAARFNDRLLAAVRVTIAGHKGRLSHLLVREVTRRHGVGRYLLEETLAQHPQVTHWSIATDPALIAPFMLACGFVQHTDEWVKQ